MSKDNLIRGLEIETENQYMEVEAANLAKRFIQDAATRSPLIKSIWSYPAPMVHLPEHPYRASQTFLA